MRLIALAEVARPHGVRGELRLKVYNSDSGLLLSLPQVVLELKNGEQSTVKVRSARRANDAILLFLDGCSDRDRAEQLRGARILVPRDAFPPPDEGEFYVCDILGARVVAPDGDVGLVDEMVEYPTCDALVVRTPDGKTVEFPLVDGLIDEVDVLTRVIKVSRRDPLEEA